MEENLGQQPSEIVKIVCFGPESTGKTTLAKALSEIYRTSWVPEFMRRYFEEKWQGGKGVSIPEDILPIAQGQMFWENHHTKEADKILFCDTDLLQIKLYSQLYFDGFCPTQVEKYALENIYHHYFLMAIDIPWEADNLRDKPEERAKLFKRFETELIQHNRPYTVLEGDFQKRVNKATQVIEKLLNDE